MEVKSIMWMSLAWLPLLYAMQCRQQSQKLEFHLVRKCQRFNTNEILALENLSSFEECVELAHELRGLAINYAPGGSKRLTNSFDDNKSLNGTTRRRLMDARSRLSAFEQPGKYFNCHVLQCPQNQSFSQMVNDSRFDYYSLYGRPVAVSNYSCVPEVGLFVLNSQPLSYANASLACGNASEFSGGLAHIASEMRTNSLAQLARQMLAAQPIVFPVYVGLQYNRSRALNSQDFRNIQGESLTCFLYRAWDVGQPKSGGLLSNASCVALTSKGTWQTLSCEYKLPYICEIFAASNSEQLDIGANAAPDECGT